MRYPYAAAAALLGSMYERDLAAIVGCATGTVGYIKKHGFTESQADAIATHLGYHPARIWPEFEAVGTVACANPRCRAAFHPQRRDQRYCTRPCMQRAKEARRQRRLYRDPAFRAQKLAENRAYKDYVRRRKEAA